MLFDKPQDIEAYKIWLQKYHGEDVEKIRKWFELVSKDIKDKFENSSFWTELLEKNRTYSYDYKKDTGCDLLISSSNPTVSTKDFDSLLDKSLRLNILNNKNWPEPPDDGWFLPNNWFSRIGDIIRTRIIVKYLDGVEFLIPRIETLARENKIVFENPIFKSDEAGYYAVHLYVCDTFEVYGIDFDTEKMKIKIEIQLTTQLQEIILKLLHKYYEARRKKTKNNEEIPWQWNYKNNEFATNYLGHILHYIEGMIVDIRQKQESDSNGAI